MPKKCLDCRNAMRYRIINQLRVKRYRLYRIMVRDKTPICADFT